MTKIYLLDAAARVPTMLYARVSIYNGRARVIEGLCSR